MVSLTAPLLAMGAVFVARKALNAGFTLLTGSQPPDARDPHVRFDKALLWTVVTAATAAVIEVEIYRVLTAREERNR